MNSMDFGDDGNYTSLAQARHDKYIKEIKAERARRSDIRFISGSLLVIAAFGLFVYLSPLLVFGVLIFTAGYSLVNQ